MQRFFSTGNAAGIQAKHKARLEERLQALHTALSVDDMDIPGWRLHPFLKSVYVDEFNTGNNELARKLHVSAGLISRLLNEKVDVSPEMALKLSKVIGRSPESWLSMQDNYNLWQARQKVDLSEYESLNFA